MSPITHFLVGWVTANSQRLSQRERVVVTLAGVASDIDGAGIVAELATRSWDQPLLWYSKYHHTVGHNLSFAVLAAIVGFVVAERRWLTAGLAFLSVHLHLLGDVVGSRGPDGFQWPLSYLFPFSDRWKWTWNGQWELNAWPNFVVTFVALGLTFFLAWKRGVSPLEMVSAKANRAFVETLRRRFPRNA
ncbi:MAG: metal-dependent hydrolase [Acidobacteriota bacterium]